MHGKVKWFDDVKGYGFITCEDGQDAFVHAKQLDGELLLEGQTVELDREIGPKGLRASAVRVVTMLLLAVLGLAILAGSTGCAADRATLDHRAAVMNGLADKLNAQGVPAAESDRLDMIWAVENERRAAVNLSDAAHWRKPTYPYAASRPAAIPWTPTDAAPAGK